MSSTTVASLRPDAKGVTLTVKVQLLLLNALPRLIGKYVSYASGVLLILWVAQVVDATTVMNREPRGGKGASVKVAECLVGDETGVIIFVARNEQGESAKDTLSVCFRSPQT